MGKFYAFIQSVIKSFPRRKKKVRRGRVPALIYYDDLCPFLTSAQEEFGDLHPDEGHETESRDDEILQGL